MPESQEVKKATLQEVEKDKTPPATKGEALTVQFNPQSLKLNYSNQQAGNGTPGGTGTQHTGRGVTKLSLELFFDVTAPKPNVQQESDVRKLTQKIAYFITPKKEDGDDNPSPPAVRFSWGSFLFDGVMEGMDETLDFFSASGVPLRATVSITLVKQELDFQFNPGGDGKKNSGPTTAGTLPNEAARSGDSLQQMAGRAGKPDAWKAIAAANKIENPRMMAPGTFVNMNPKKRNAGGR
jgi:Contractile injection system tube protein